MILFLLFIEDKKEKIIMKSIFISFMVIMGTDE